MEIGASNQSGRLGPQAYLELPAFLTLQLALLPTTGRDPGERTSVHSCLVKGAPKYVIAPLLKIPGRGRLEDDGQRITGALCEKAG